MFHWDNPTFKKNTLHFNFNMKIGSGYVLPLSVLTSPNFFQQDSQQVSSLQYVCAKGGQVGYNKARSVVDICGEDGPKKHAENMLLKPLVQIVEDANRLKKNA